MFFRIFTVLFLLSMPALAQTAMPSAEVNEMTPNNIGKNTLALTPEMQQKFMAKVQNMTPQQRQAIMDQAKSAWGNMSPTTKDAIKTKAMEQYNALTPEQKQQMQQQAMLKWQSLSVEEKQQLGSQFQGLLQGNLQQ